MTLRPYQQTAAEAAFNWLKYKDTPAIVVLPTGGGKTHVLSALIERFYHAGKRVVLLAHRKELLEQAGDKLAVPFGFYSASVGEKNLDERVIVAGIQSVVNADVPPADVILIDECHRVPPDKRGIYWDFFSRHPAAKLCGMTATPYRLDGGELRWGEVVYRVGYSELLHEGFLAPLVNKVKATPDVTGVATKAGEYDEVQLDAVMSEGVLVAAAARHIREWSATRRSVLIFCVSVAHAVAVMAKLAEDGIDAALVTGGTPKAERERIMAAFRSGACRFLVNVEIALEGFDAPNIDMVVCLRPTQSKALWEQLIGRGVRKHPDKQDCLLLDMAGNLMRHGGLGSPYFGKAAGSSEKTPGKICPRCESFVAPAAKECPDCHFIFPELECRKVDHEIEPDSSTDPVFAPLRWLDVLSVGYAKHVSRAKGTESLRIDYFTPYEKVSKWLSPLHGSEWVRQKTSEFFAEGGHSLASDPNSYSWDDLLWHAAFLRQPKRILVDYATKFPEVKKCEYETSGERDTAGVGELLEDDFIPF